MAFTQTFTTSAGFATSTNVDLIQNDVVEQISTTLTNIKTVGDCIELEFEEELSQEDTMKLHNIITTRDNFIQKTYVKTYFPEVNYVSNTLYQKLGNFSFPGTNNVGNLRGIDLISYMDLGLTSYTVQLINRNDNSIVCEQTFTNTSSKIKTISTIFSQPNEPCILQVSVKNTQPASPVSLIKLYSHVEELNLFI